MTLDHLYRCLLSCYPAEFRGEYSEEMLLLYRERAQAEPRSALWMDIVADLLRTAPKEHFHMIWNDLSYAFRALRRTPVVTAAVVATLALTLGANTAIFSVVQSILLNPLPYADGGRLVRLWESNLRANQPEFAISVPNFVSWRDRAKSFSDLACWRRGFAVLVSEGDTTRVSTAQVSGAMFRLLGYRPTLGRGIAPEDESPSAPAVAVLSQRIWSTRYGSDPQIVGKELTLPGGKVTIVGVVPADREFFRTADVFVPLRIDLTRESRGNHTIAVIGRLRDGVTLAQADAEMKALAASLAQEFPKSNDGWSVRMGTAYQWIVPKQVRETMAVLLGAVAMVLLIACANISNLMMGRATARRQEMAVRSALGAARSRLVRLLLTETVLLAVLGGAAGLALAYWSISLLRGPLGQVLPRVSTVALNTPVLLFAVALTLGSGLLFGLAPAWQVSRSQLAEALKSATRGSTSGGHWTRKVLVGGQLALATALVAGAGLLIMSLRNLQQTPVGFEPEHLLLARAGITPTKFPDGPRRWAAMKQILDGIRGVPGVRGAAMSSDAPFTGGNTSQEMDPMGPSALPPGEEFMPAWRIVDPEFFRVMGIPLKAGRFFTEHDSVQARALIVSEGYAQRLWPGPDSAARAIGKQMNDRHDGIYTIVGVVGDVRAMDLTVDPSPINYFSAVQGGMIPMNVIVKTEGDPLAMTNALRDQVKRVDSIAPLFAVDTMKHMLEVNTAGARWNTFLVGGFASLALLLGAVGTYGVLAYAVTLRRREIGVRMALGAAASDVIWLVVREGMTVALLGIASGIALALALGRLATTLLFKVSPHDPAAFTVVAIILALVAMAATMIPAHRAAQVDPVSTLRAE